MHSKHDIQENPHLNTRFVNQGLRWLYNSRFLLIMSIDMVSFNSELTNYIFLSLEAA